MTFNSKRLSFLGALIAIPALALSVAFTSAPAAHAATVPQEGDGLLLPTQTVHPKLLMKANAFGTGSLPDSVDLRAFAPTPGDQGSLNSCVSWALGYTIAGWYANKLGTPTTFAPMYIYSQTHLSNNSDGGGSYVRDALNVTYNQGEDTLADYQPQGNYDFTDMPTSAQTANAAYYKTNYSQTLFATGSANVGSAAQNAIETSLAAGTPVGLGIPLYANFYYLDNSNYNFTLANATGSIYGYHYVAVFGYDSTGVWIENSWNSSWGQNGFAHLGWDFVNTDAIEAESVNGFAASSIPQPVVTNPTPTPTPTPSSTINTTTTTTTTTVPDPTQTTDPTPVATPTPTPVVTPTSDPTPTTPVTVPTTPVTVPSNPVVTPTPTNSTSTTPVTVPTNPVVTPTPTNSAPTTVTSPVTTPVTTVVPAAPQNISTAVTTTTLTFKWGATGNGTTYRITITGGGKTWGVITNKTSYQLTHLAPNTTYTASIRAENVAGASKTVQIRQSTQALPAKINTLKTSHKNHVYKFSWSASTPKNTKIVKYVVTVVRGGKTISKHTYKGSSRTVSVKMTGKTAYKVSVAAYTSATVHTTKTITIKHP